MLKERVFELNDLPIAKNPIVYWMQREHRVDDNWSLIYAHKKAIELEVPLVVVFTLSPKYLNATIRQYDFMLKGIIEVEENLAKLNIPLQILFGNPTKSILKFLSQINAGLLITDFNPLKIVDNWKKEISKTISIPFHEVDAHNIVPCRIVSKKLEYAAYTIRPKLKKLLSYYLDEFPKLEKLESNNLSIEKSSLEDLIPKLKIDKKIKPIIWLSSGEKEAKNTLQKFIQTKLDNYFADRNNPTIDGQSNLSPYLHFGQISSQRIFSEILKIENSNESKEAFLEELFVRKELADNFCFYNNDYDNFEGFHDWAKLTLNEHRNDKREIIYSLKQFESFNTFDELWNAAQAELVITGKMHGYMRMYWAKKILEWTATPEDALNIAIYLNDKYSLDGCDPNGYAGIAWSIGGVHDRAWNERLIFGKIRYMNYNGCKRKFNVDEYISKHLKNSLT